MEWIAPYCNDHHVNCGLFRLHISTRCKKGIEEGRVCKWNIYMMFHELNYCYVQIEPAFEGTLEQARRFAEKFLLRMKEGMPI
jgi:hypothetical protein